MKGILVKDYKIIDSIGEGGMATVYLAEHQLLGQKFAIKILHDEFVRNKNIRNRFIAEAKNMARMSHQNIIKVTDLIDAGDLVAFVMEYMEGQTLKEYLETKGKLSDDEIKKLFVQMLDAVGYVHEQGLVHRDIKPSNFMISANGVLKLLDFGIAKNTDVNSSEYTMTGTTQSMGTPMYMSPEQIKSTKDVTHQTDIYSLGVVLWQMVMGKKPYNINTISTFELQMKIVQDDLPSTNKFWDGIIQKATAKNIGKRYNNCLEIRQALNNLSTKRGKIEDNQTILSDGNNKNFIEENIKVKKTPTVRKKKNTTINTETSQKVTEINTKKSSKFWHLLWIMIPILVRTIVINSDQGIASVVIGNQEWMVENLDVETFRNGDVIPEAKSYEEWIKAGEDKKPAWCYLENDSTSIGNSGRLYNWYAVNDHRGLAPKGWHIPDDQEWNKLITFLGGEEVASAKMRSTTGWSNTVDGKNGNGNNSSGFNSYPFGIRVTIEPYFSNDFDMTDYWSSSKLEGDELANYLTLWNDNSLSILSGLKSNGFYVRCIKDN